MKKYLFFNLFFLALITAAFSQQTQPVTQQKTGNTSTNNKTTYQPRDFNYTFVPDGVYSRFATVHLIDSASQKMTVKQDSSSGTLPVIVEKDGDQLTLRGLTDPTAIHYREKMRFQGVTNDGSGTLVYKALTDGQGTIYINPVLGYVVIGFKTCDKRYARTDKDCDANYHYFGNVPGRKYMP